MTTIIKNHIVWTFNGDVFYPLFWETINSINSISQNIYHSLPSNPLVYLIAVLCWIIVYIALIPNANDCLYGIRLFAIFGSVIIVYICGYIWYGFHHISIMEDAGYKHAIHFCIIPEYNLNLSFGLDGISLCFLLLTAFIMTICIFAVNELETNYKAYIINIYLVYLFLVLSFCVTNLFFFFVFFESVLIPMFLIIGLWGPRQRKIKASYYFFFYTLFGSFFLLFGILWVYLIVGSLDYQDLFLFSFSHEQQKMLFFFFFIPFAIKIPMFPFHIWLPEAHVEAPTVGSVILAALLLKLGGYGFLRFTISMLPFGTHHFSGFVLTLACIGIFYGSLSAFCQSDLKRIIAYSSIAHMNLIVVGLFSMKHQGIDGSIVLMIGHGLVSAGLFFSVGVLSDRYATRDLKHYSGLAKVMPLFALFFLIFTLGNMAFPVTSNFPGELLIISGIFQTNPWIAAAVATSVVSSAIYSIWTFNRVAFGTLKNEKQNTTKYADLNRSEFLIFFFLAVAVLFVGLNSSFISLLTYWPIKWIIKKSFWRGRK